MTNSTVPCKFREKEPIIYDGDLMDEEGVLDFLTSLEAMDLPDRIEEVNAKILQKIIEDTDFVAVLFCEYKFKFYTISLSLSLSLNYKSIFILIMFTSKQLQFLALKENFKYKMQNKKPMKVKLSCD